VSVAALLVDAAGTLIQLREPPARAYQAAAQRHGLRVDPAHVERALAAALAAFAPPSGGDLAQIPAREREAWRAVVRAALGDTAADGPCFADLHAHFATAAAWEPLPGARAALDRARAQGLGLAVVSNMDARLPRLLAALELQSGFSVVAIPSTCGFAKPDPRIFRWALQQLGVEPAHALYLGDRARDCVDAARAAGLAGWRMDPRAGPSASPDVLCGWSALEARLPAMLAG
jgi:REG-2-like HAD superfamily hydrolase